MQIQNIDDQFTMPGSEDSEEESQEEQLPVLSWSELSIIERVGLNSKEMSEEDLETAFSQIALAFRCDQYTLKQRLQAEEHARNLAEENIQLELTRGRETLETLRALCLDSKRSKILQRLELCLDILGGTVERISNTAEVLGAVHQEARVSRAVELMVAHVENLKRRHDRNAAELEETKKLNSHRSLIELGVWPDAEETEATKKDKKNSQHHNIRRRVSISLISSPTQEERKQDLKQVECYNKKAFPPSPTLSPESSCSILTKDDGNSQDDRPLTTPDDTASEASAVQPPLVRSPTPNPECATSPLKEVAVKKAQNKTAPLYTLRHRQKGKAALTKKRAEKNKKGSHLYRQFSVGMCGSLLRQRPLAHWRNCCRWALLCMYLCVLLCVVTLIYSLWKLPGRAL